MFNDAVLNYPYSEVEGNRAYLIRWDGERWIYVAGL